MSDLISRSRVIENIWDVFNSYANDSLRFDEYETEAINRAFTVLQKAIKGQPTAYNPDKVVEEIKAQFGCKDCEYVDEFQHPACNECAELEVINDICDIVKRGGVE